MTMRDEVLMSLIDKAMTDPEFRSRAVKDLDGALQAYGYELEPDEMEAVRAFQAQTAGKSDAEVERLLAEGAADPRRQGA
jgi:N-acetyl-anhydromuramyl-L-alanine amidase AmpD